MKQTVEVTLDVPEGWESTGEYRRPRKGEYFLTAFNQVAFTAWDLVVEQFILRTQLRMPKVGEVWMDMHGHKYEAVWGPGGKLHFYPLPEKGLPITRELVLDKGFTKVP